MSAVIREPLPAESRGKDGAAQEDSGGEKDEDGDIILDEDAYNFDDHFQ